eukprot:CAMPEP_0196740772 /NCGR_PEP_ID=MMETSP1091-20130531/34878_1 /TAXON_ID=302021 /ORGANISM="Rhodomonas sp., Strain CCMP768" /LENGTH=122 /DNA_ID=CAMNT_0042086107 /DNA_START=126 /DNA_END=492 /DNA_ORIENTATION=-
MSDVPRDRIRRSRELARGALLDLSALGPAANLNCASAAGGGAGEAAGGAGGLKGDCQRKREAERWAWARAEGSELRAVGERAALEEGEEGPREAGERSGDLSGDTSAEGILIGEAAVAGGEE